VWKIVVVLQASSRASLEPCACISQIALRKRSPTAAPCHSGITTKRQARASTSRPLAGELAVGHADVVRAAKSQG
jgi:hypothetical protein